jgi:hypothetical protein
LGLYSEKVWRGNDLGLLLCFLQVKETRVEEEDEQEEDEQEEDRELNYKKDL